MSLPASAGEEEVARWSREDDKAFENSLATIPYPTGDDCTAPSPTAEDSWLEAVAARVPGKTIVEVKKHYELLMEDVNAIDGGRVPIPRYADDLSSSPRSSEQAGKKHSGLSDRKAGSGGFDSGGQCKGGSKSDLERKKGIPWTEEEHRLVIALIQRQGVFSFMDDWKIGGFFCLMPW